MLETQALQLIVPAKLAPPQPLGSWIPRERLLGQLRAAPHTRVVLVVAPAGFGKSTLVAQWLQHAERRAQSAELPDSEGADPARRSPLAARRSAWLTLDEHDQDGLRFLTYLAGAIEQAAPGALQQAYDLLAAPATPPYVLLQALLIDLSALPGGLTIVLDDYDTITAEAVHQALAYLLRNLPPQCRLILIARADPPLPLARLRAERQVTEIRAADLRFTAAETAALLATLNGAEADTELVAALHQLTEGWAIALQLAALAQLEAPAQGQGLAVAARQITEYLAGEVLALQPAPIQQLLLAMAVPERFCTELCAALLGTPDELIVAESRLEQLVRANLLLIPLDEERHWYRFHHLFRDLLLRRLQLSATPDEVRQLQLRAAHWFTAAGQTREAVSHFLAAGHEEEAADMVERQLQLELDQDVLNTPPGYWLGMLPTRLVARRPGLALIAARLSVFSMDLGGLQGSLQRVEALLAAPGGAAAAPPWPSFWADLEVLRGILGVWQGLPGAAIPHLHAALSQRPTRALAIQAYLLLGLAYTGDGRYHEGVRLIEQELPSAASGLRDDHEVYRATCLCWMHQMAGQLEAEAHVARRLAEAVAAYGMGDLWVGYAAASLGLIAYERNELDAAAGHFATLTSRRYKVSYPGYMTGLIGQTLVALARGALDEAEARAHEAWSFVNEVGGSFLRQQAQACLARVALARGEVAVALRAVAEIGPDTQMWLSIALETPQLSQAWVLIAAGDSVSLTRADHILTTSMTLVEPLHNTRLLIRALATQALLRQAQGRPVEARAALERAVDLAAPRGMLRTFLDLGPPLPALLRGLAASGVAPDYLRRMMAAEASAPRPERPPPTAPHPALPELLTPRETEILILLARRWSDKEIAEQLTIALNTVRKHTSTIYQKLGVGDRRGAVTAAQALGLLTTDAAPR